MKDNNLFIYIISTGLALISGILSAIKNIKELIIESRSKSKLLFFIYELLFIGFSVKDGTIESVKDEKEGKYKKKKKYQLKGLFVGKEYLEFESMSFKLPHDDGEWENNSKYYGCEKEKKDSKWNRINNGASFTIESKTTLKGENKNPDEKFKIGEFSSYDIEGNYVATEDDTYNSLRISLLGIKDDKQGIIEDLKVIKCPNIRKKWLLFYIFLSMLVIFIGVSSTLICIKNNWDYILNASLGLKLVFGVFGFLLLLTTGYFMVVIWKCLSSYFVLIRMKKFGVPAKPKSEKVSNKLLIPKTIEFMSGGESVDNIL